MRIHAFQNNIEVSDFNELIKVLETLDEQSFNGKLIFYKTINSRIARKEYVKWMKEKFNKKL